MVRPVGILHTTQGTSFSGAIATLNRNRSWSHELFDPKNKRHHVFIKFPADARSLRNLRGGVETNHRDKHKDSGDVWQLEIIGYAEKIREYDNQWYRNLAEFLKERSEKFGIPFRFPYTFKDSRGAYGVKSSTRLTRAQWLKVEGFVGHQHVPENTHWDPGPIDVSRILQFANTEEEVLSENEVKELQSLLVTLGADLGKFGPNNDGVDGDWGDKSRAGLKAAPKLLADMRASADLVNDFATYEAVVERYKDAHQKLLTLTR